MSKGVFIVLVLALVCSPLGLLPLYSRASPESKPPSWEELSRIRLQREGSVGEERISPSSVPDSPSLPVRKVPVSDQSGLTDSSKPDQAAARRQVAESGAADQTFSNDSSFGETIVYSRVPRTLGRHTVVLKNGSEYRLESPDVWDRLPDTRHVFDGFNAPGQLVVRQPSGTEFVLYDCFKEKIPCVPLDAAVSLDGKRVLFSVYRGKKLVNAKWNGVTLPNKRLGDAFEAQLYVADIETRSVSALAHEKGVFDVSPGWLPDGRIIFASTRNHFREPWLDRITPNRRPETQLFLADERGENAVNVTPHEVTTAMHPYVLKSGRIAYGSQWLSHNLAYFSTNGGINWPGTLDNMWVVMDMDANGGDMTALFGAHRTSFKTASGRRKTTKALHFLGERRNGDICVSNYYRGNNLGLGDVICWEPEPIGIEGELPNFTPRTLYNVANWSKSNDEPSFRRDGVFQGKIGYPEGVSGNQLMLTVGRGYCTQVSGSVKSFQKNVANQPSKRACDVGLYRTTTIPSASMSDLATVVDDAEWLEFAARAVSPRKVSTPELRTTGNDSCELVSSDAGTAETRPSRPYRFNKNYKTSANNGGEIDGLDHSELDGIRFWEVLENKTGKRTFKNSIGNQLRLLGDVRLLPDKSFKVRLPCETPYLMAGLDSQGRVIKRDQVPQSLRTGEKRVCTGCHLHSRPGRPYAQSQAYTANAVPLLESTAVPDYRVDIQPIFQRRCVHCHEQDVPLMNYTKLVWDPFQKSVPVDRRLQVTESKKEKRRWGLQRPYSSKYVNTMFARESLLYWKAANMRSDGRTDATYADDIDFGVDHPVDTSDEELRVIAAWLDAGAPLEYDE